jgi:hypothetical protein
MKQLQMTPELSALIKSRVGDDVETDRLAVFEAIALNTMPLPGKDGTIFENAVVEPITLTQMVDYINSGNHLPLIADHELFGAPKGRFFHAGLNYDPDKGFDSLEMRALFYLDQTEEKLIAKLNAATLDEVSVAFLSSQFLCSECGWDYFEFGTTENIATRTCANGHTIGEDDVHARMIGLQKFIELSLVARGAADKPKIIGRSESKLAPESAYRLAAHGFEPHALVVMASLGEKKEVKMDPNALVSQLADLSGKHAVAAADVVRLTGELNTANTALTASQEKVTSLETELAAAKDAKPEDYEAAKAEASEAVAYFQEQLNHLRVAKGEPKLEGDKLPSKVADLKAQINELTGNLTSILPTGGVARSGTEAGDKGEAKLSINAESFAVRK